MSFVCLKWELCKALQLRSFGAEKAPHLRTTIAPRSSLTMAAHNVRGQTLRLV